MTRSQPLRCRPETVELRSERIKIRYL
jgi:hypothetical protein